MKKSKIFNVIIGAVLVAFIAVVSVFALGNAPARFMTYAEEETTEEETPAETQDSATDGAQSDETAQDEETPDEDKETQETEDSADKVEFDLDAFLAYVQKYADQAGIGDDYAKAVEAIKTAASEKQVTISTIASVAEFGVFLVFIIYYHSKNGALKKSIIELSKTLDLQVKGTNGLIDGSNANGQTATETKQEVDELKSDIKALKSGFSYLLSGLSSFVERFNIGAASKETVKREFNRAVKQIDGETDKEYAENENQA